MVYAKDGWAGDGDWLGTGRVGQGRHRSFKKARAFVRGLGLKSQTEWHDYCHSGKKPPDIPANPNQTYMDDGWAGTGDWLGYARKRQTSRHVAAEGPQRVTPPREEALTAKGL